MALPRLAEAHNLGIGNMSELKLRPSSSALVLQVVIELQVVHLQIRTDALEGLVYRIRKHEQAVLMLIDRAPALHGAPIEDLVPVAPAIDQNQVAAWEFAGLHQREHLPELVHGAEAAGENNQGLGQLGKPKLAHEEVMEIEAELRADEGVGQLLVRQLEAHQKSQSAVARLDAGGTEHHDGVTHALASQPHQRVQILPQYADRPRWRAFHEFGIAVRHLWHVAVARRFHNVSLGFRLTE